MIGKLKRLARERDARALRQGIQSLSREGALHRVAAGWDQGFFNDAEFCDTALQVLDWEIGETLPLLAQDQLLNGIP